MPSEHLSANQQPVGIVPLQAADAQRTLNVLLSAFFFEPGAGSPEVHTAVLDWRRTFGATREGADLAGVYTSFDMQVTVPGGAPGDLTQVPMAGLSWVAVHPDHRRRGVMSAMLRHHLADLHESGAAPIGGLLAAEVAIYGRFGYGVASVEAVLDLGRGADFAAPALDDAAARVETRFVAADCDEAATRLHEAHLRCAATSLGAVARPDTMARPMHVDIAAQRKGREPTQVLFASVDGETTGYALFNRKPNWENGRPQGKVSVSELAAADPATLLALARRLVDFDLTAATEIRGRSMDDPLIWWAGGPRASQVKAYDSLWLRLVDLDTALAARGYAQPCELVLDVVDAECPWNQRKWRLSVQTSGTTSVESVAASTDADLRLPVHALGAAYLGARTVASQAHQGLVEELRPGAVRELSMAMQADRAPIGSVDF
ncbi:MAG: GNAT family N-acetyltransferase [Nocardioidaceae bacterium]|nr:GNAT family N-acetyltransferase [Nocardioidaceae bacterium]